MMPKFAALIFALICTAPPMLQSAATKAAPAELNLTDMKGAKVRLRNLRGKIAVVNFWATWCGPCNEEMPMLVAAAKEWAPRGVVFIGASLDDRSTRKNIPAFVDKYHAVFDIWQGATADDLARLGLGQGVPDTVFVDESGNIVARVLGEIKRAELIERLEWITGDRTRPAPAPLLRNM